MDSKELLLNGSKTGRKQYDELEGFKSNEQVITRGAHRAQY